MRITPSATIFDVQRFSIHDGPGIRTVVFFKGCSLACRWCQNPEAKNAAPEIAYYADRCVEGCTRCEAACDRGAIGDTREARVDLDRCNFCGACSDLCPSGALQRVGTAWSADALLAEVSKDRDFYEVSGGGITLSGGEPVLHVGFLQEFLPLTRGQGLHVAIETAGAYPFAVLESLLPLLDLVLFDLKVLDARRHLQLTGRDNRAILENLQQLVARRVPLEVRMPVVPDHNTDARNVAATARRLEELGVASITLLPYNHLWEAKLTHLGCEQRPLGIRPPDDEFYATLRRDFARHGIATRV